MTTLDNKAAYLKDLARVAEFLTGNYLEEVRTALPDKSLIRIKNVRSGQVRDAEVYAAFLAIAERERLKRYEKAVEELRLTKTPLVLA